MNRSHLPFLLQGKNKGILTNSGNGNDIEISVAAETPATALNIDGDCDGKGREAATKGQQQQ